MAIINSSEMFINIKDAPVWDPTKHFFDQKKDTLLFYEEELVKIKEGINIGGFFVHPLLYFHLNFFKTPIPTMDSRGNSVDVMMNPPLDDNILYIIDSYREAEINGKILFLFGARGIMKSTFISSHAHHTLVSKPNGIFKITGGDDGDLNDISSLINKSFNDIHPVFFIPTLTKDWKDKIDFGFKDKSTSGKEYVHNQIIIQNARKGADSASEKGAGGSPSGFVIDEVGKFAFLKILEAALPGFRVSSNESGFRLVPILSGTSGNDELTKDAQEVLENPDAFDVLPINHDRLRKYVPEDQLTWDKDFKRTFGTFVPGQMSYRLKGVRKIPMSLGTYLGSNDKRLKSLKINVTDWEKANAFIAGLDKPGVKKKTKDKNKMYYPRELDDCFLTSSDNPFPVHAINKRIRELELIGNVGKNIEIFKDGERFTYRNSDKDRAETKHRGGNIDAPIVLFGEFPKNPPEKFFFLSALDDYKLNTSGTDSLGAFYVIQRRNLALNTPCEKVVASLVTRPERHVSFHQQMELMIEAWSAECMMEAIDVSFEEYMERKGKAARWLAPAITFAKSKDARTNNNRLQRKYGLPPTEGNNTHRQNILVDWTWEEHAIGFEEDGTPITKLSVEFLDDIDLLKELRDWKKGVNSDRKEAFSHALLHAFMLDTDGVKPTSLRRNMGILQRDRNESGDDFGLENRPAKPSHKTLSSSKYGSRRMGPYRR